MRTKKSEEVVFGKGLVPVLAAFIQARLRKEGITATAAPEKRDTPAAGQSVSVLQPSAMQPRSLLIGKWYGEESTLESEKQQWIAEKYPDGTYKIRFRTYRREGGYAEQTETGYWGICGSIYFTIFNALIENDKTIPVDATDPSRYDADEIITLTDKTFEYKHVANGQRFLARKVGNDFQFPQSSP
ncbi:MAG: hypothetical protein L7F78_07070 [Syntrophales bacterium LBB04]|nr:hypothetical protein [Syntrophales bacterium LBB04]